MRKLFAVRPRGGGAAPGAQQPTISNDTYKQNDVEICHGRDYDSFGSMPRGEISRRIRKGHDGNSDTGSGSTSSRAKAYKNIRRRISSDSSSMGRAAVTERPRANSKREKQSNNSFSISPGLPLKKCRDSSDQDDHIIELQRERQAFPDKEDTHAIVQDYDLFAKWSSNHRGIRTDVERDSAISCQKVNQEKIREIQNEIIDAELAFEQISKQQSANILQPSEEEEKEEVTSGIHKKAIPISRVEAAIEYENRDSPPSDEQDNSILSESSQTDITFPSLDGKSWKLVDHLSLSGSSTATYTRDQKGPRQNLKKMKMGLPAGKEEVRQRVQKVPFPSSTSSTNSSLSSSSKPNNPARNVNIDSILEEEEDDWLDYPTQKTDPDLKNIRRKFLRADSSTSSKSTAGHSANSSKHKSQTLHFSDEEGDTEGLPAGYYRRRDGVILSFGSSTDSSSEIYKRYENNPMLSMPSLEAERDFSLKEENATRYLSFAEFTGESSATCDKDDTQEPSKSTTDSRTWYSTLDSSQKNDTIKDEIIGFHKIVQSFEEQIEHLGLGMQRRAKARSRSVCSKSSTSSVIRRAKAGNPNAAQSNPYNENRLSFSKLWGIVPEHHEMESNSSGYDDSTITTKESKMPKAKAIIDMSQLNDKSTTSQEYKEGFENERDAENPLFLLHRYRELQRQQDSKKQSSQLETSKAKKVNPLARTRDPPEILAVSNGKKVGFVGVYPEPTRRGDRVPELVTKDKLIPWSVSDISSMPNSKLSTDSFFFGYGGNSHLKENVTGFIDKISLAFRQTVFPPNSDHSSRLQSHR